ILFGIACQLIQLYVSIRDRKDNMDVTGDPWNAHTLEWSTSSPPPFYNFATMPEKVGLDAWTEAKRAGIAYKAPAQYAPIHMPNNTATGLYMGALLTVFGFATIWHIWWLAAVGLIGTIAVFVAHAARDDQGYMVPAEEVARIEGERLKHLGLATGSPVGAPVESFERV
ncbi:MAG: cytochrome o ubiquinol oxidase subunit I, partial [Pseudomonas qingdaonensis]